MGKMSEDELIKLVMSREPEGTKITKVEKDGYTYFKVGELNIDRTARLLYDILKEQGKI